MIKFLMLTIVFTFSLSGNRLPEPKLKDVYFERVKNTIDQLEFFSRSPIDDIYLNHTDINVRYRFMNWSMSPDRKKVLIYDHYTNVEYYDVIIKTHDGRTHRFLIKNLKFGQIEP